ncbi:hypothetical protein [Pseudobacteroides cellulosolvens]|uniref:Lipoprotein n=1 Tax=Pseudobacteroides cellulosolvens ATCC 35603 = DSM 2933 TaxID=398512 RepID=A0A0L6JMH0_9FIRM|nr:hypothetical protein [Pseudobacteroides cellulosolvens]KNY26955.1 hypothetical protein Bccel_2220 [Pseudobacteroides cellulosolvens ATCC 35603 = DSM 2933]
MKKQKLAIVLLSLFLGLQGCSSGDKTQNSTDEKGANPTIPPAAVFTVDPSQSVQKENIEYTILSQFKPFQIDKGYGAMILIKPDSKKDDIIELIKRLSKDKDPVAIDIFCSQKAYDEYINHKTTDEFKSGYIANYTKNKSYPDKGFYGVNEMVWMQEKGSLSDLYNTTTQIND